ncbi:hypothetical protein D3C81_2301100 [compost metagenome]
MLKSREMKRMPLVKGFSFNFDMFGAKKYRCLAMAPSLIIDFISALDLSLSNAALAL